MERKTRYKLRNDVICFNTQSPMLRTTQCVQHGGRRYVLGINLEYVMGSRLFQGLGQRKCYTTVCSENQKVNSWFYYRINSVHGSICRVDHFRNSQLDAGTGIFFTTGSITELYSTRWSMVRLNIPLNLVPYNFGIIFGKFSVPLQLADELNAELFAFDFEWQVFCFENELIVSLWKPSYAGILSENQT